MKKLLIFLTLAIAGFAQTPQNVQKGGAAGANNITGDLNIGTGRTLTIGAGATLTIDPAATFTFPTGSIAWSSITSTPTTLAGYGITDPIVLTSGSYADPAWITSLAATKLTGTVAVARLPALTGGDATTSAGSGVITLATVNSAPGVIGSGTAIPVVTVNGKGLVTATSTAVLTPAWSNVTSTPTSVAGYGVTNGAHLDSIAALSPSASQVLRYNAGGSAYEFATLSPVASLTGDGTASVTLTNLGSGSGALTLATVATAGTTGSSTAIPVITINAKGLTTGITTAAVVAPAGTLTGGTLAAGVLASSLTSVGTLTGGATGAGFTLNFGTSTLSGTIPNGNLANSAMTIAGTSTSLGGSITQDTITGLASTGLVKRTGANTLAIASAGTDYEVPLTFSTGLTRSTNTVTVNTSQNIATLSNLTTNGLVTTSGGTGALSVTVPGTGVLTALAVNVGSAGAFVTFNGAGGTPSSLTGTNITGTASGLTAGHVTTNANLTGDVTSSGNATTIGAIHTGAVEAGYLDWTATTPPANPAGAVLRTYNDSSSGNIYTLNSSGTVYEMVQPGTGSAHNFLTAIGTSGALTFAQPVQADITGLTTADSPQFTAANLFQAVGAAYVDGLVMKTTTAATSGNQKWAPALHLQGNAYKTGTGAGSQPMDFRLSLQPAGGSTVNSFLYFQFANGSGGSSGSYTNALTLASDGTITTPSSVTGTSFTATTGGVRITDAGSGNLLILGASMPGGTDSILFSTNGSAPHLTLNGDTTANQDVSTTGAPTFAGVTLTADASITTLGKTVKIKSGSNGLAGTVTLSSGAGTITSTAIDVNTVIVFSLKTSSGTPGLYQPLAAVGSGTAAVTGLATDNSTYNWVAFKVN